MSSLCLLLLVVVSLALPANARPGVSDLSARYRAGQVFLTWAETDLGPGARLRVLQSAEPITPASFARATVLLADLEPGSATDWWLNPETFGKPLQPAADGRKPPIPHQGWIVEEGAPRLDPDSGLYVHTVSPETAGRRWYAVVPADGEAEPGGNSLTEPVEQQVEPTQPVWQGDPRQKPAQGSGNGLPLDLSLHAKTGQGSFEWLVFGDAAQGWRDGLPAKFGAAVHGDSVLVRPTDRTWIGRMFAEGKDECQKLTPAIHSFWYGYSDQIHQPDGAAVGTATNYTERRLLWLVHWVQSYFGTDPNRSYCAGGSMGGCGTFQVAYRHPEIFAACAPHVAIVTYGKSDSGDSTFRVSAECGDLDRPCSEGMTVRQRLDTTWFVQQTRADLPFLVMVHGRNDGSIPWAVNPPFYRALEAQRQGFIAHWNEGDHGGAAGLRPPDIAERSGFAWLHRFALNQCYLALGNCSADQDPGAGPKADGDPTGAMNRGLDWDEPVDATDRFAVVLRWYLAADQLPVTVDVTPRRVQGLTLKPGARFEAANTDLATDQAIQTRTLVAEAEGLLTFTGFQVTSAAGNRLTLTPAE